MRSFRNKKMEDKDIRVTRIYSIVVLTLIVTSKRRKLIISPMISPISLK